MDLKKVIRPNILKLAPYSCARDEFKGVASIYVDANESPYDNGLNRYPDPLQHEVKTLLASLKDVEEEQIFLGNGSDEAIDLVYRIFCEPGKDNVVAPAPTYGMYQVCAEINDVEYRAVPLTREGFLIYTPAMMAAIDDRTKVIWICSPNNPTGNAFDAADIEYFLKQYPDKIVVVDEAYIDFSEKPSMLGRLSAYPNLIVLQTFSKAWGHAAMRLGIAYASKEIIGFFNKVKYPYNVNELTQREAIKVLRNRAQKEEQVEEILGQRDVLQQLLLTLDCVEEVFPSDANFLLVRVVEADAAYHYLQEQGIVVRNRNKVQLCAGCLRITVGTPEENAAVYEALREMNP